MLRTSIGQSQMAKSGQAESRDASHPRDALEPTAVIEAYFAELALWNVGEVIDLTRA
jgi:hypothetical protein